jgi:D-3-phosphoglycerate dehydrogenase
MIEPTNLAPPNQEDSPLKLVITDADYPNLTLEHELAKEAGFDLVVESCRTPEEVIKVAATASALLVQYAPITREVLEALPELRVISRYGVGVDTVDVEAAAECNIWVANVPDYGIEEVACHAFAMSLSLIRHLPAYDKAIRGGTWHYLSTGPVQRPGTLTLGLVGLGRIGRKVADYAGQCYRQLLGYDPNLPASSWPQGIQRVELQEVFERSDVISLHLPLVKDTQGLVNRSLLSRMPKGSYLVNTARGGLIELDDLLEALEEGRLAGAALDVLPQEPPPSNHPLLEHPHVLLSPHAAFYSVQSEEELRRKAVQNVIHWVHNGRPIYPVLEIGKT